MVLVPIGHENMTARRWPVVTLSLIAIHAIVFVFTTMSIDDEAQPLGRVKSHILILAALHPELKIQREAERLVDGFERSHPDQWKQARNPNRDIVKAYNAQVQGIEDEDKLQGEMDALTAQYVKLSSSSITELYAFVPAHPSPSSYVTANFLHAGWMHLIGNLWFLWLAGFVLEDVWGRWLYPAFYLIAGAAALQFHAWLNPGSITPTLGASGAVAALMGAFLVRFPKMKIEMAWVWWFSMIRLVRTGNPFRVFRFQAAAYWLLPLWLAVEILYGTVFGSMTSVAHWAHVGGFAFGAVAALAIRYSGIEHKANQAIEKELAWTNDAEVEQASSMMEHGQWNQAQSLLIAYIAKHPSSLDAWSLLRQIYSRQSNTNSYLEATVRTCRLHLKAHQIEAAFEDYAEFLDKGGGKMPASSWLELCKGAEALEQYERAFSEYEELAKAYPTARQSLTAQLSAARLCLKKLNRPKVALAIYQAAAASPVPHLDWEQIIQSGIKEAKAALSSSSTLAAGVR